MLLSSNLTYVLHNYIGLPKKFWKNRVTGRNDCSHWTLIPPSSNLNCWAQLHELITVDQYARTHLKPQNFARITIFTVKFYKVMPVANIFSFYWSCIHGISESQRNDFLNLNEMVTKHRTENLKIYWLKSWNFSRMNILKLQNSISWDTAIEIMLFYFQNKFWNEFRRLSSWLPTSVDLHISTNLELILGNWQLAIGKWNIWKQIW